VDGTLTRRARQIMERINGTTGTGYEGAAAAAR
jgi:hypothetical protein